MAKRLSPQQQAIRRGARPTDGNVRVLYATHSGPQTTLMTTDAQEVLYGGAAGGGKSYALRAYGVNYCLTNPGAKGVLFRRTYPQLEETHLIEIQKEVPASVAHFAAARHDLIFPNGSILMFRFCEQDDHARRYDTSEFDFMLFDELTHFSQFQYTYLTSRCRSTRPGWIGPRFRAGATPLGIGHAWVKERWGLGQAVMIPHKPFEVWTAPVSEGGMVRQFIPARVTDNKTLFENDPDYLARLKALPYEEYQAKALGNWDVLTGQFFMRWRPEVHVISPFDIPPDWERFMCVDYGFDAPYAVLWFARPPGGESAFVYREHYGSGVLLSQQIRLARQAVSDSSERIRALVVDPSIYNRINVKGERIDSMASDWETSFADCAVVPGSKDRVARWRLMREMIDWTEAPTGGVLVPPKLHVFRTCPNLIRTIPSLVQDENRPEDVDTDGEDHAADALGYGLVHAFKGAGSPDRKGLRVRYDRAGLRVGGRYAS